MDDKALRAKGKTSEEINAELAAGRRLNRWMSTGDPPDARAKARPAALIQKLEVERVRLEAEKRATGAETAF